MGLCSWFGGPLLDAIWPRLQGPSTAEPKRDPALSTDLSSFQSLEDHLRNLYSDVQELNRTVDTRLAGLLLLSSAFSAVSVAGLLAAASFQPVRSYEQWFSIAATLVVFYILVQSCCCLLSAVAGLRRRRFRTVTPERIVQVYGDGSDEGLRQLINEEIFVFKWNNWVYNGKVDHLEVAYVAFRNLLIGALVLYFLATIFALWKILCTFFS